MPLKGVDIKKIAKETKGYSGADLEALCREAGINALRENIKAQDVKKKHFDEAMDKVKPSIGAETLKYYDAMMEKFKNRALESKKSDDDEEDAYVG